ncbi:MAG: hypothetical protein JWN69_917 [Alphaproteobacteria bacterium]|nr:hypothetical protein [Alphaproteobacteria bacterium]
MDSPQHRTFEDSPVASRQIAIAAIVLLVLALDGLDLQLLGIVAPVVIADLGIDKATFGPALAAAMIGMAIGSGLGGWIGDRFGRKTVLLFSAIWFSLWTVAASYATDVTMLILLRFISGLGFGAASPNGLALATEWLPQRARPWLSALAAPCVPAGGMLGAALALLLLSDLGWRGTIAFSGTMTLLVTVPLILWLPESAAYLKAKGKIERMRHEQARILGAADAAMPDGVTDAAPDGRLFTRENLRINIGAPLAFFLTSFTSYGFVAWTTVILTMAGLSIEDAVRGSLFYNSFAVIGPVTGGFIVTRWGTRKSLITLTLGSIVMVSAMAILISSGAHLVSVPMKWLLFSLIGGVGITTGVAVAAIYAVFTSGYAVSCRASGIGFGLMMGRVGGIGTMVIGGFLLSLDGRNPNYLFLTMGVTLMMVLGAIAIIDRHVPPQPRRTRISAIPQQA